ncbi:MAG: hypothetical protein LBE67_05270 [Kocuria palustris]|nr:hypothetical protein [Kocuria palustris]
MTETIRRSHERAATPGPGVRGPCARGLTEVPAQGRNPQGGAEWLSAGRWPACWAAPARAGACCR